MGQYNCKSENPGEGWDHIDVAAEKKTQAVRHFKAVIYVDILETEKTALKKTMSKSCYLSTDTWTMLSHHWTNQKKGFKMTLA